MADSCKPVIQQTLDVAVATNAGSRPEDEDNHLVMCGDDAPCGTMGLFVVADGMGNIGKGAVASAMAVETISDVFPAACQVNTVSHVVEIRDLLRYALQKANAAIYRAASQEEELRGSGTTCVAAAIAGGILYLANVGDSRAYLMRDGCLEHLTEDEWVREGQFTFVNQAVGLQPLLSPKTSQVEIRAGDVILLTTDGLTEAVPDDRIESLLQTSEDAQIMGYRLVDEALKAPHTDNITVIVIKVKE